MANKTGYMDKERAESERRQKEHLAQVKEAQAESRAIHQGFNADVKAATRDWDAKEKPQIAAQHEETTTAMKALAAETRDRTKSFVASNREYAKTLGKFDDNR